MAFSWVGVFGRIRLREIVMENINFVETNVGPPMMIE
jgi:hypothetical protein